MVSLSLITEESGCGWHAGRYQPLTKECCQFTDILLWHYSVLIHPFFPSKTALDWKLYLRNSKKRRRIGGWWLFVYVRMCDVLDWWAFVCCHLFAFIFQQQFFKSSSIFFNIHKYSVLIADMKHIFFDADCSGFFFLISHNHVALWHIFGAVWWQIYAKMWRFYTFFLSDKANQNADGVLIHVLRNVWTVTCRQEHCDRLG